jgi:hypothetical protein
MRTKTILTVAVGALSVASAMAVTSVNVVGYVNVDFQVAFQNKMLVNPLAAADNRISSIIPNGVSNPNASVTVQKWNALTSQFSELASYIPGIGWDAPDMTFAPGEGFALQVDTPCTLTFVGDVRQSGAGLLSTPLANGYNLVGSQVPQTGGLETVLGFDASTSQNGITVQLWDVASQQYFPTLYSYIPGIGWDAEPALGMAEACIIVTAESGLSWSRNFNVQ